MELKTKKNVDKTEKTATTKVEKKAVITKAGIVDTASRTVIKAKAAKPDKGLKAVKVTKTVKKAEDVTPTEPIRKAITAKVVKPVKVAADPKPVVVAKKELKTRTAKLDSSKPRRLSASMRTHIRRMKQAARQEGTVYHAPLLQRTSAK